MAAEDLETSAGASAKPKPVGFRNRLRRWVIPPADLSVADGPGLSNRLAQERTNLALDRSYLAHERTLQAWVRTALSMISFGFTLGKLGTAVKSFEMKGPLSREYGTQGVGYFLVMLGTCGLACAIVQHVLEIRKLRRMGLQKRLSIAVVIAMLLTILGGFAFTALVLEL